ncbi:MAG: hypothetical protein KBG17_07060, partial [Paludibacteraceae bacterium]|nr:hypothetical protein [Paludibacteraceae bacterium]
LTKTLAPITGSLLLSTTTPVIVVFCADNVSGTTMLTSRGNNLLKNRVANRNTIFLSEFFFVFSID